MLLPDRSRGTGRFALATFALAALALSACSEPTGPEKPIDGPRLYAQHCARCHGPDGKGLKEVAGVRDLTDANLMGMLTDERIKATIRMGKPPTMPAFSHFAEPSLKVLVAYVRQLSSPPPPASQPAPSPAP
jgi:mono/diheme cytochrome c family protein